MFDTKGNKRDVIQDPKTGETIIRQNIPPEIGIGIQELLGKHSQCSNDFIITSQNYIRILKKLLQLEDIITKTDQDMKVKIKDAVLKLNLDPKENWGWNIQLGCLEKRVPPLLEPLKQ